MSDMAERYARATQSSRLRLEAGSGDVDVLIAAGAALTAGTVLLRCRHEWDSQRAEVERVESDALRSRVMLFDRMRSIPFASAHLFRLAADRVARRQLRLDPEVVARAVGNALDIWLDQRCNECSGRGINGGAGKPVLRCGHCRSNPGRRRRVFPSKTPDELTLGEWLIARAEVLVAEAESNMKGALR